MIYRLKQENFQKSRRHLKILGTIRLTQSKFHTEDLQILDATVQTFSRYGDLVLRTCTFLSETQLFMLVAFLTLDVTNVTYFETSWYFHIVIFSFPPIKFIESKVQLMRILVIKV